MKYSIKDHSGDGIEFRYTRGEDVVIVGTNVDAPAIVVVELLKRFMLAAGYTAKTVSEILNEDE